jgi:hypothetical protein
MYISIIPEFITVTILQSGNKKDINISQIQLTEDAREGGNIKLIGETGVWMNVKETRQQINDMIEAKRPEYDVIKVVDAKTMRLW